MSDCPCCPVEKQCDYKYKPCDCVHQRKFVQVELKPYQIDDFDIVLAKNEEQAKEVALNYYDNDTIDKDNLVVEDLSNRLDIIFHDEGGKPISTLGRWIKDMNEPQYVVGWE